MLNKILRREKIFSTKDMVNGYEIEKVLGEGRYGIAYLAKDKDKKVVIKQLKSTTLKKTSEKLKYESEILSKLEDDRFPKFISKFKVDDKKGYILEYKDGKTFEEIIYKDKKVYNREEIYEIGISLIKIIKYLYDKGIVHKDIRVSNVILTTDNKISLIDFGLARYINDEKYKKEEDYWYLADFLVHLYYTSYVKEGFRNKPWYEELNLYESERTFLRKLMGIEEKYKSIKDIENDFNSIFEEIHIRAISR